MTALEREYVERAKKRGALYVLVVCDTFSYEDYPVMLMSGQNPNTALAHYDGKNMQRVHIMLTADGDLARPPFERTPTCEELVAWLRVNDPEALAKAADGWKQEIGGNWDEPRSHT